MEDIVLVCMVLFSGAFVGFALGLYIGVHW